MGFDAAMQRALEADAEKLSALTGEDHQVNFICEECPEDFDCHTTCCCGDLIEHHGMGSGHSPVSMHWWYCEGNCERERS